MFSLESPHRGDSNVYTQNTYSKSAAIEFFTKGLKNDFETAVVSEPTVFKPLKFYCISFSSFPLGDSI